MTPDDFDSMFDADDLKEITEHMEAAKRDHEQLRRAQEYLQNLHMNAGMIEEANTAHDRAGTRGSKRLDWRQALGEALGEEQTAYTWDMDQGLTYVRASGWPAISVPDEYLEMLRINGASIRATALFLKACAIDPRFCAWDWTDSDDEDWTESDDEDSEAA